MAQDQNNATQEVSVDLSSMVGKEGVNLDNYNMIDTEIEHVIPKQRKIKNDDGSFRESYFLDIQTKQLDDTMNIRGRTFINFWKEEDGTLGFSLKENSNSYKILNYFKVDNFNDLVGKKCQTIVRQDNNGNKKLDVYFGQ